MPSRKKIPQSRESLERMATDIGHKFHMLEESLQRVSRNRTPAVDLAREVDGLRKDLSELEKASGDEPARARRAQALRKRVETMERTLDGLTDDSDQTLEAAEKLLGDIKQVSAEIPEIAEVLDIAPGFSARPPKEAPRIATARDVPFKSITSSRKHAPTVSTSIGHAPIDVSTRDNTFRVSERPHLDKLRIKAAISETGEAGGHLPLNVIGVTKDGKETVLASGTTSRTGYLSLDARRTDLSPYERIELATPGKGTSLAFQRSDLVERITDHPIILDIPGRIARTIREQPKDFISIDDPDAEDLVNDPASFSFDAHEHDGSACIKARPEVAVRDFSFSQLVRAEETDLVEQDGEDAAIRERSPVTAPMEMRESDNPSTNLSVVGGRIITGKIIHYRQSWQPAAQGLGKLLYSLALAPREEIKLAVIDWQRTDRSSRQDAMRMGESVTADLSRDTTVSDIVTGTIEEEISGGSDAGSTTEANNQPSRLAYLGGALVGGLLGGGIGAGLGVAAVHYIRPDTGADSEASIDSWNNAVRNISAQTVHQASDIVRQRASAVRDLRSTVITTSTSSEREDVRTRTVRNQNQHHALNIQYYQVLAHYRVVTEAQSEEDVLMVPYAIDHDVFASLPGYTKFTNNPKSHTVSKFLLRYDRAIRDVLPENLQSGMDAFKRMVYQPDSYEAPRVTAARWTLHSPKAVDPSVDLLLETDHGLLNLRPLDQERTRFASNPVPLDAVRGLHFRFDARRYLEERFSGRSRFAGIGFDSLPERLVEQLTEKVEVEYSDIQLTAHLTRSRYLRPNVSIYTLDSGGRITLGHDNPSATLNLTTPPESVLRNLLGTTPSEADYQTVEQMVAWIHRNPMTVMAAIWMSEDPHERALRFDRYSYNGKSLLNIIENRPIGVDGNYVAFRLAPNLRVLPPIDLSRIARQTRVVSVPTSGVFAETYLSCHNATEKRDVTREIDQDKAVPFAAPEIAPVATGTRSGTGAPQPMSLPSPVVNLQTAPETPRSAIGEAMQSLTAGSPFPNISHGAETMETIRTLADTAMKVDGEKQKQILDTITELSKVAADAAFGAAQAAMGLPPTGAGISGGGSGSTGRSGVGPTQESGRSRGTGGADNRSAPGIGSASPEHRANVGRHLRSSDPATNYDHVRVVEEAEQTGHLTADQAASAIENIVGATGTPGTGAAEEPSGPTWVISADLLRQIYPSSRVATSLLEGIAAELSENLERAHLDSELRLAHFFAQVRHETGPFLRLEENLNYTVDALQSIFSYYRNNPEKAAAHGRNEDENQAADQEAVANHAYANRMGNGDPESGDGWRYRGRGMIQLTGRDNYAAFTSAHETIWQESVDFVSGPSMLAQERYAVRSALEYWMRRKLYELADQGDSEEITDRITSRINPGAPASSREARYDNLRWLIDSRMFRGVV